MSLLLTSLLAPAAVAAAAYLGPQVARPVARRRLESWCAERRVLVLSFDDGPGRELTTQLLSMLAEYSSPATFFPLGRRAADAPELVERLVASGHEVGCHTQWHHHPWKTAPRRVAADIRAGFSTLRPWLGASPLFRPPYGKLTLASWSAVYRRRARLAWWTLDSEDTRPSLPQSAAVARRLRRAGGGVVLMHDFDRSPQRAHYVLDLTRRLLDVAAETSLRVVRLGDLLDEMAAPQPQLATT